MGAGAGVGARECIMANSHMVIPPMDRETDRHTIENITFPQLRWRTVNIRLRYALSSDN